MLSAPGHIEHLSCTGEDPAQPGPRQLGRLPSRHRVHRLGDDTRRPRCRVHGRDRWSADQAVVPVVGISRHPVACG